MSSCRPCGRRSGSCTIQQVQQSQLIQNALTGKFQATAWKQFNTPDPDGNYVWWSSNSVGPVGGLVAQHGQKLRPSDPAGPPDRPREHRPADPERRLPGGSPPVGRRSSPISGRTPRVWMVARADYVQNFNGPTFPDGSKQLGMISGIISVAEMWRSS